MSEVEVRTLASLLCFCYCQNPAGGGEKKKKKIRLSTSSGKKPKLYLGCITLIKISCQLGFRKAGVLVFWWMLCMPPWFCSFISWNKVQLYWCSVLIRALFATAENPEIRWVIQGRKASPPELLGKLAIAAGWHSLADCHGFQTVKLIPRRNVWEWK